MGFAPLNEELQLFYDFSGKKLEDELSLEELMISFKKYIYLKEICLDLTNSSAYLVSGHFLSGL